MQRKEGVRPSGVKPWRRSYAWHISLSVVTASRAKARVALTLGQRGALTHHGWYSALARCSQGRPPETEALSISIFVTAHVSHKARNPRKNEVAEKYPPTGKLYILYYPRILYVSAYLYIFENCWPHRIQYVCASVRILICTGWS